jgi:holliday junction DNA helicase RuvB
LSRFLVPEVPDYTFEEFKEIAIAKLEKENIDRHLAQIIIEKVWSHSRDIRDAIKVGRLVRNEQEVSLIITMMKRNKTAK